MLKTKAPASARNSGDESPRNHPGLDLLKQALFSARPKLEGDERDSTTDNTRQRVHDGRAKPHVLMWELLADQVNSLDSLEDCLRYPRRLELMIRAEHARVNGDGALSRTFLTLILSKNEAERALDVDECRILDGTLTLEECESYIGNYARDVERGRALANLVLNRRNQLLVEANRTEATVS